MLMVITGGRILDPATGIDRIADLWIKDNRIIDSGSLVDTGAADRILHADGCVVMAGGIDIHTHIGGGKLSLARMLLNDDDSIVVPPVEAAIDNPVERFLPTVTQTAGRYLDMGYTTCFEPAVIPCNARASHAEMSQLDGLTTGGYCLLGNDDVLMRLIAADSPQSLINDYVAWMVAATRCIAVKVVNPGGINAFKFGVREMDVDTPHPHYGVTPGQIIRTLCRAVHEIGLVHPLHVHCSNLGVPGNIRSTLATIAAADGLPIHLTHAQFHCYGDDGAYGMSSAATRLVDAMNRHPNVTIDVGQIMFGQTVTISADSMHQYENRRHAKPRKTALVDIECEAGCGVVPFRYRRKQFVHSLQWAIGLELFLMIDDPSRVFLTTDHPNGAPFTTYPHLLRLLGDRSFRETALAEIQVDAAASSQLGGIDRQYSLNDIAIMTRQGPARILGLSDRGHLAVGAVADIAVYQIDSNLETMFSRPLHVISGGRLVRSGGVALDPPISKPELHPALVADVRYDADSVKQFQRMYRDNGTFAMNRLAISDCEWNESLRCQDIATKLRERSR
ncbi:formylmethanofuran dehydrogenase subunit A [Stieleria varia]|uniref:Formyltransferase/hydrolase complex Fhc subunit A n=1 Tax=Stieleria varia TaxID=2528005 RepID=A0A5C6BB90_9BACT|nr:formylmethanofuran dehydrogenase subunit A [Stieleria varia]TWU08526.1 Formyltransferase/hydrolase complex Fhc subunit A [Stieleria varia]